MGWVVFIIIGIIILGIVFAVGDMNKMDKTKQSAQDWIRDNTNENSITFKSFNCHSIVSMDEKEQVVTVLEYETPDEAIHPFQYKERKILFNKIIQAEVMIDDETYSAVARGNQAIGIGVGALALGGVGAVIGGLSAKTNNMSKIKSIDIKLTVNDLKNPIAKINFLNVWDNNMSLKIKGGREKTDKTVQQALKDAEQWQGMFDVILKNQTTKTQNSAQ